MISIIAWTIALCGVLLLASLSGLMSEKSGVTNVGVEGMMIVGALVVSIIGTFVNKGGSHNLSQIWVLPLAGLITGIFAMLHAFPSITLKSNQIVSGIAINILALGLGLFLATSGYFGEQSMVISSNYRGIYLDSNAETPVISLWVFIAVIIAIVIALFFKYTKQGMRYAMVGENPNAIDAAGISVAKYRYIAVFISGVLAGLAGGVYVLTVAGGGFFSGNIMGYGFLGVAIMIFGQWKIHYMAIGTIIFSFLFAFGQQIGAIATITWVKNSAMLFKMLPFILTIGAMIAFSKSSKAPAAVGVPFDKSKR
ncbi:ribose/galactose ABC transporter permease [Williamsoniiplasma somnilux]|uniref:Ribose/galactose ABC transporter permease n=1 Tax=Williamsoniiplasma somnilux TaxID=215578 RepID=A0A2K8NX32_9MOLU|nr:ABC transporter permease [Williamsoniiplasma somnilux]ATZ18405.1 ribose/galactose ABC transporter permease [Williamsoniiplasma somnilux]